jgi:hypothetical protein
VLLPTKKELVKDFSLLPQLPPNRSGGLFGQPASPPNP